MYKQGGTHQENMKEIFPAKHKEENTSVWRIKSDQPKKEEKNLALDA